MASSRVFRLISAIVSVIVLAAALVQIVTGWDATLRTLRAWGLPIHLSEPTKSGGPKVPRVRRGADAGWGLLCMLN